MSATTSENQRDKEIARLQQSYIDLKEDVDVITNTVSRQGETISDFNSDLKTIKTVSKWILSVATALLVAVLVNLINNSMAG